MVKIGDSYHGICRLHRPAETWGDADQTLPRRNRASGRWRQVKLCREEGAGQSIKVPAKRVRKRENMEHEVNKLKKTDFISPASLSPREEEEKEEAS